MLSKLQRWFKQKEGRGAFNTSAVFRYKFGFRRNGRDYWPKPFVENLILDSGLNKVAGLYWAECWKCCLFGNAVTPTPVRRDSLGVTFTTAGNICTGSGNFFTAADVGRLIKFNDGPGQEFYITVFTSALQVTLSGIPTPPIAAVNATIWYVNETALDAFHSSTFSYQAGGANNGTSAAGNVITYKRTFIGAVLGAPVTLTEIGFAEGTGVPLFDRDIITGGVSLLAGDQALCIAQLLLTITPAVNVAVGNVATGYDSTGNMIICGADAIPANNGLSAVDINGNSITSLGQSFEPSITGNQQIIITDFVMPPFSNGIIPSLGGFVFPNTKTLGSYSAGNFFRDTTMNYDVATGNGPIFGINLGSVGNPAWVQKFTTPFTKLNTQTLSFTIRRTWQRILIN